VVAIAVKPKRRRSCDTAWVKQGIMLKDVQRGEAARLQGGAAIPNRQRAFADIY